MRLTYISFIFLGLLWGSNFIYVKSAATLIGVARADGQSTSGLTPLPALAPDKIAAAAAAVDVALGRRLMKDPKRDAETLAAFARAAGQDNPVAETYLGYLYYMGHGTRQDDETAALWYQRAAEQGFVDAELRLGLMYAAGRDLMDPTRSLPRDRKKALHWLAQAAYRGSWLAANQMAEIYVLEGIHNGHMAEARQFVQDLAEKKDPPAVRLLCLSYGWVSDNPAEKKHRCDLRDQMPAYLSDEYVRSRLLQSADIPTPADHL
ncbi:MAG TPA: tetratricopeptide repeat protein [Dongiaceae bacterium]|nr:tetratricopeptide repeat protein [Dongiaceae bacterium]